MKKITKKEARKLYISFHPFIMCASNLRPDMFGVTIGTSDKPGELTADFDSMVNEFSYYNCTNRETGQRVAFYVN